MTADLRWAQPDLKPGYTVIDLNKTGNQEYFSFRPDEDVLFIAPTDTRTLPRLQTDGGHNIVLVGGHYAPSSWVNSPTLYFTNVYGQVHVEGVYIDNQNAGERDGIAIYGAPGARPDISIQNSRVMNIQGTGAGVHGDVFQTHGPVDEIRIYNLTGTTNCQGLFIPPQQPTGSAYLENINISYTDMPGDPITYLYWFLDNSGETPFPITLRNVYAEPRPGQDPQDYTVWPKDGLGSLSNTRTGDQISWPGLPYDGHVTIGKPALDFAPAAQVGLDYDGAIDVVQPPAGGALVDDLAVTGAPTHWFNAEDNSTGGLTGTDGNDQIAGRAVGAADHLAGGGGDDGYIVNRADDVVVEAKGAGVDTVLSYAARYKLSAAVDHLTLGGTEASDGIGNGIANRLTGNDAANRLDGRGAHDVLFGNGGADVLKGGAGKDALSGGAGADTLRGGDGADVLAGGAGHDRFVYAAASEGGDVILDFTAGQDRLDLRPLLTAQGHAGADGIAAGLVQVVDAEGGAMVSYVGDGLAVSLVMVENVLAADLLASFA